MNKKNKIDISKIKLVLRQSQQKFKSNHYFFEVIRTSLRPLKCYLNRQLISLLDTRSIPKKVFLDLQEKMIENLMQMTINESTAIDMLSKYFNDHKIIEILTKMLESGIKINENQFLHDCLISIANIKLNELELKSRIFIENGGFLLGVADETGILKYGQVFIKHNGKIIHNCRVVIAKNPAFHPGDMRVLEAIDVPQLRHIENCLVFPVNGDRDHANECSGSDLDGDLYFVTWDTRLIPITENFVAMDYTPGIPAIKPNNENVTVIDMINFFVSMFKTDQLGKIANAHLAHYAFADEKEKLCKKECLELAKLHSLSVDYPKVGGKPIEMDKKLVPNEYPMFMQKSKKLTKMATNCVIEQLYLQLIELKEKFKHVFDYSYNNNQYQFDKDLIVSGYQNYLEDAWNDLRYFERKMERLLSKHGNRRESNLITHEVKKPMTKFEYKRPINHLYHNIIHSCQDSFKRNRQLNQSLTEYQMICKASAFYFVTINNRNENKLLSMPWLICNDYLCKIKKNSINISSRTQSKKVLKC